MEEKNPKQDKIEQLETKISNLAAAVKRQKAIPADKMNDMAKEMLKANNKKLREFKAQLKNLQSEK